MSILRQDYRNAMARLGAAVNVITSNGVAGRYGLTASAVFSVTDAPPTLAVCINRSSRGNAVIKKNGVLCVNTLANDQEGVSSVFSGSTKCSSEQRFNVGEWSMAETGSPLLRGAAVSFDCRITDVLEKGTHTIFFGEVETIFEGNVQGGLIYFQRQYHAIGRCTLESRA